MKNLTTILIALGIFALNLLSSASAQFDVPSNQQYMQEAIQYYRYHTGDYNTPDQQAIGLGAQLWCSHNPGVCEAALNPNSYNNAQAQLGQTYSDILDIQHNGYKNRSAMQSGGQANYVQGAIHGESNYVNAQSGAAYSLPVYPDPSVNYSTPDGYPLSFDYQTNMWYQGDGSGYWYPLNAQR